MSSSILEDLLQKADEFRAAAEAARHQYEVARERAERAGRIAVDYKALYVEPCESSEVSIVTESELHASAGDLSKVKAIDGMYAVLKEQPDVPMHANELVDAMEARGWVSESEQPRDTLSVALRRLSPDDIARNPALSYVERSGRATYVFDQQAYQKNLAEQHDAAETERLRAAEFRAGTPPNRTMFAK